MTTTHRKSIMMVIVVVAALVSSTAAAATKAAGGAETPVKGELIELSYTFNDDAPNNPKYAQFQRNIVKTGYTTLNFWMDLGSFCASEHSGTHVDAPRHFGNMSWALEAIPLDRLWRIPGVMVNVSSAIAHAKDKNYEVKVRELERFEKEHGVIPDGAIVIIHTGWGKRIGNIRNYAGLDQFNKLNFPGLGKGAAEWLTKHGGRHKHSKGVVAVGIDTLSLDKGFSARFPAHVALAQSNIYGVESMANLEKLPATGFYVTVMPLRIRGGSGSPARVIAEVGDIINLRNISTSSAAGLSSSTLLPMMLLTATLTLCQLLQQDGSGAA